MTLLLDGDPDDLHDRRLQRGKTDAFEMRSLTFHTTVRDAFLALYADEPDRIAKIDAIQSEADVLSDAMSLISKHVSSSTSNVKPQL